MVFIHIHILIKHYFKILTIRHFLVVFAGCRIVVKKKNLRAFIQN